MAGIIKIERLTHAARVRRVDVYVHWSVFLISALVLLGELRKPIDAAIGLAAYYAVLVLHEAGHLMMARHRGYDALSMEIYPVFGLAYFERPDSRLDRALIAWGGVIAQAAVGIPLSLYTASAGYTRFEALNAALAILGGLSLLIAVLNLLPIGRLDGSTAWDLIPAWIEQRRNRRVRRSVPYRSTR
jgi:Zn-dependent protease